MTITAKSLIEDIRRRQGFPDGLRKPGDIAIEPWELDAFEAELKRLGAEVEWLRSQRDDGESACQTQKEALDAAVQLVRDAGLATGHADDYVSLMREVLEQYEERRAEVERLKADRDSQAKDAEIGWAVARNARAQLDHLTRRRDCVTEETREVDDG